MNKCWLDTLSEVASEGWRRQVRALVEAHPQLPMPDHMTSGYMPEFSWDSGHTLERDYLDSSVYRRDGQRVSEEVFINEVLSLR